MECGHGLDTRTPQEASRQESGSRRRRRRREAARRRAEALCERLVGTEDLRPGGAAHVAAVAFGVLTHVLGLAVLAGSLVLLANVGANPLGWLVGLLGCGVFFVVRPRVARRAKAADGWLRRADLPKLFALLDRASAAIGAPVPEAVAFNDDFNASTSRRGIRQRPVLKIGLPLWAVLDGPGRLALLGHELGHQINGDTTRGTLVGSAKLSLRAWQNLFRPYSSGGRRILHMRNGDVTGMSTRSAGPTAVLRSVAISACLFPVFITAVLLGRLLDWLAVNVGLRAEFLADDLGAQLGSTDAAVGLIRRLAVKASVATHIQRTKFAQAAAGRSVRDIDAATVTGLWQGLWEYIESVPDYEYQRQIKVSEIRGTGIDRVHPADHLRLRLLVERSPRTAAMTVSDEEWQEIDAELAPQRAQSARRLLR